jgi:hypothetical protein
MQLLCCVCPAKSLDKTRGTAPGFSDASARLGGSGFQLPQPLVTSDLIHNNNQPQYSTQQQHTMR